MTDPFLKWPGGKRWLISRYETLFPKQYERYVEPFLGGGSVFFAATPKNALLSDSNNELINTYLQVKKFPLDVERSLFCLQKVHDGKFYYEMRNWEPATAFDRAVRFIYLNRTCFNGIYRVNRTGKFNVPIGSKSSVSFPAGYLGQVSQCLNRAVIIANDFAVTLAGTGAGDFVFIDPPYTVMHNNNGFIKYNSKLFSWDDQARLSEAAKDAAKRGALVMIANADHASIRDLYKDFGSHYTVCRKSVLASRSVHRRSSTELVITSYSHAVTEVEIA